MNDFHSLRIFIYRAHGIDIYQQLSVILLNSSCYAQQITRQWIAKTKFQVELGGNIGIANDLSSLWTQVFQNQLFCCSDDKDQPKSKPHQLIFLFLLAASSTSLSLGHHHFLWSLLPTPPKLNHVVLPYEQYPPRDSSKGGGHQSWIFGHRS